MIYQWRILYFYYRLITHARGNYIILKVQAEFQNSSYNNFNILIPVRTVAVFTKLQTEVKAYLYQRNIWDETKIIIYLDFFDFTWHFDAF